MEPDRVNIDANEVDSANFQAFIKDVNDCIDDFDIILRNEKCLIYHEDYGIWIEAEIIDVHLSSSCYYHVNYNRHFSGSGKVLARNVRLNHSFCSCGSYVPRDYLKKHRDCAVHLGHALTKVYLRFLAEYKGLEVTVRGQQATLEETCKPWLDENIRFRLKLIENGEEIEESFQNIDCGHQCIVCRKVFTGAEIVCHLETHFYGLNVGPLVGNDVLAQMSRDLIEKFQQFDWGLKKAQAIVHDEEHFEWILVELQSLSLSKSGCATYHVRHLQRNADNEWVEAQNVRNEFWICPDCATPAYFPRHEVQEHVSSHTDDSGIFG
ncbi:uncharacterized protein LOC129568059 isoform X3 [Sitodiplosis mosellana]|nr:uncharacterized protein LOC129568059 isoform X3 [Sitodiplosis mosellana]